MIDPVKKLIRPLTARDRNEEHRTATSLELLFDLVFVIAIAAAAHGLEHEITHGHTMDGIFKFFLAFYMIWWPLNLFTWFASSFDNCDVAYRVNVMVMMVGAMFIAASMPDFFKSEELTFIFIGYIILRLGFAALWIRAWKNNPKHRTTAMRYIIGQFLTQAYWTVVVFVPEPASPVQHAMFLIGIAFESFVPWYAEKAETTHWHKHHVTERFGLLNIIVLGEILVGSGHTLSSAVEGNLDPRLFVVAISGIVTAFFLWWIYFSETDHIDGADSKRLFTWAYGHVVVFGSGAAVGVGLGVVGKYVAEADSHNLGPVAPSVAVYFSIPVALYLLSVWCVRDRYLLKKTASCIILLFVGLIGFSCYMPYPPVSTVILLILCLIYRLHCGKKKKSAEEKVITASP